MARGNRLTETCFKLGIAAAIMFLLFVVVFLIMFVSVPILIKRSLELQRSLIFPTNYQLPPEPEFDNFKKYNIKGGRNLHVLISKEDNITLGVWHLLPHASVDNSILYENFTYSISLALSQYPVVIHFHNNRANRAKPLNTYNTLRNFFHVIAFDYRGYGDSTETDPSEDTIIQDSVSLYKWLRNQTDASIYFWGHALGAALSAHTAARLLEENIVPMGLILEAPFTSMRDQIQQTSFYKFFAWLPWYESAMLNPLEKNGFIFNTIDYITRVNCPVMIIHAEDDSVTPYQFAEKLFNVAREKRTENQGNVTFHLLPEHFHCGHFNIRKAPKLQEYIRDHIVTCRHYNKAKG